MAIQARLADTQPGPTLMDRILPGPIKNRSGMGLKQKTQSGFESGLDFRKKPGPNPNPTRPDPTRPV